MLHEKMIINVSLSIRKAMQILESTAKKVLFVENNKKLIGAISDGDIRRWILRSGNLDECVDKVMNHNPIKMEKLDHEKAIELMHKYKILAIPVVDEQNEIIEIYYWSNEGRQEQKEKIKAQVVIMAGGKGERLLPYTSVVPKPLIPIGEYTITERVIDSFKRFGCSDFIISVNYKKNMIKAYFEDIYKDYKLSFIEEEKPLGTGGSLALLKGKMDDTFIVSNCDILLDVDYSEVYHFHKNNGNLVTIITSLKHYVIPYGIININDQGNVKALVERPGLDYLVNTGVYFLEPRILELLEHNKFTHITELIDKCIVNNLKVGTFPISEEVWMDMGQFKDMDIMKFKLENQGR